MKRSAIGITVGILTVATAAWAFSRDLSGLWKTNGKRVLIVHDTDSSTVSGNTLASLNWPMGPYALEFRCEVSGANGSTHFGLHCSGEDLAINKDGTTCTVSDLSMVAEGQLLGQWPGRSIQMSRCGVTVQVQCISRSGKVESDHPTVDCSGTWQ